MARHRKESGSLSRRSLLVTPALGIGLGVLVAADAPSATKQPVSEALPAQPRGYFSVDAPPRRQPPRASRGIDLIRKPLPEQPPSRAALVLQKRRAIIDTARAQFGVPYDWGGTTRAGFDCSGLVQWVYRQVGIVLPRVADDQAHTLSRTSSPLPGDLVCFTDSGSRYVHHIGIYLEPGYMIDAPHAGTTVGRHALWGNPWFGRHAALSM